MYSLAIVWIETIWSSASWITEPASPCCSYDRMWKRFLNRCSQPALNWGSGRSLYCGKDLHITCVFFISRSPVVISFLASISFCQLYSVVSRSCQTSTQFQKITELFKIVSRYWYCLLKKSETVDWLSSWLYCSLNQAIQTLCDGWESHWKYHI